MASTEGPSFSRKRLFIRVVADLSSIIIVALPLLLIHVLASPFHRGFFCNDQSLMHPYKEDTIPTWAMSLAAFGIPIISVLLVECILLRTSKSCVFFPEETPLVRKHLYPITSTYRILGVFVLGITVTQFITDIGKYSVGRLRPHFLTVCNPQQLPDNCSSMFITGDACQLDVDGRIKEARLSFPSGHASVSMYSAVFLIIYLQAKLVCKHMKLLRPALQVMGFCLAFYTCLSRISDYKHHWSDVLGGGLLGIIVCYLLVISLTDFHHHLLRRPLNQCSTRQELLPMYNQSFQSSSSSSMSGHTTETETRHSRNIPQSSYP